MKAPVETLPAASVIPHCLHSSLRYREEMTSSGPQMQLRRQQVERGLPRRKRTPENAAITVFHQGTDSNRAPAYWGASVTVLAEATVQVGRRALLWSERQGQTHSRQVEYGADVRNRCRSFSPYHYWMTRMMIRRDRCSVSLSRRLRVVAGSELCSRVPNNS